MNRREDEPRHRPRVWIVESTILADDAQCKSYGPHKGVLLILRPAQIRA